MAHLNNNSTVDVFLVIQLVVTFFERVKSVSSSLKGFSILLDLSLVVINVASIFFNIRLILVAKCLSVLNSVLEVSGGKSESFGSDKHVGGLCNLKLIVLSSEKSVSVLEALNLLRESWGKERSGRSIAGVIVIVVVTMIGVIVSLGRGYEKGSSEGFHCSLNFIDYKGCVFWTFYHLYF